MKANKTVMAILTLGLLFLTLGSADAQNPEFKSGASVNMGVPVDFNTLYQRADAIYDVVEHDDSHIVWKFTGTTGDWAFVFADGRIIVASTVDFDLGAKDTLTKELNDVMDMLNAVNEGISTKTRNNVLDSSVYYASEPGIYHRLKYTYNSNFDLTFVVPDCEIKAARFIVTGTDTGVNGGGQEYRIDNEKVTGCDSRWVEYPSHWQECSVDTADITRKILSGLHRIASFYVDKDHTMTIEAVTSPSPPRQFVLYGPNYKPWINETSTSADLQALQEILYNH